MVVLAMNSRDTSEEVNMLTVIMTHLSRGSKKKESIDEMIKVAGMKFEVNETTDITPAWNQACCSR
jgi:hypothetical protein